MYDTYSILPYSIFVTTWSRRARFTQSHKFHAYYHRFDLFSLYSCLCISINLFFEGNFILKAKVHILKEGKLFLTHILSMCKNKWFIAPSIMHKVYKLFIIFPSRPDGNVLRLRFLTKMKYKYFEMSLNWVIRRIVIQYDFIAY